MMTTLPYQTYTQLANGQATNLDFWVFHEGIQPAGENRQPTVALLGGAFLSKETKEALLSSLRMRPAWTTTVRF